MRIWADRGGTFTDILCVHPDGDIEVKKILSDNPDQYENALAFGIDSFLKESTTQKLDEIRLGTTIATNTLLERTGPDILFVTNHGFGTALQIGDQSRPNLFNRAVPPRDHVIKRVLEIDGRMNAGGQEISPIDPCFIDVLKQIQKNTNITTIAICLIHSLKNPKHEQIVGEWAREAGFSHIYLSHRVAPQIGWWARASTTLLEAYLTPSLSHYVRTLRKEIDNAPLRIMQSHGGLSDASDIRGSYSLLSGPAGGLYGAIESARSAGVTKVITFDMGGTSTDVARFDGQVDRRYHTMIQGMPLSVPTLSIDTIASGGGSRLHYTQGRMLIGPDSAGSHPGPACYRKGGPATLTDANVVLGKIQPAFFPRVFGEHHHESLDEEASEKALLALTQHINVDRDTAQTIESIASGFIDVAVHAMARAIHKISVARGFDVRQYALCAFGGAGGQHACLVAEALGISQILIHRFSSVLSAFGMGIAPQSVLEQKYLSLPCDPRSAKELFSHYNTLAARTQNNLNLKIKNAQNIKLIGHLQMHYKGSDTCLDLPYQPTDSLDDLGEAFHRQHRSLFGIIDFDTPVIIKTLMVEATDTPASPIFPPKKHFHQDLPPIDHQPMYSKGAWHRTPIFELSSLNSDQKIVGPALLVDNETTVVIESDWVATADTMGNLSLQHEKTQPETLFKPSTEAADPAYLEIFHHLFCSVAEDMGETFAKTAHSINIKERRDFSCAVFDAKGQLIANAPHVPVHLGSMGASVQAVINSGLSMMPMDAFIMNDPYHGGTHLPDITIITPVFIEGLVRYFVASRGHHADVGGITPGSMPANSTHIDEEGVVLSVQKIVDNKVFQTETITNLLTSGRYPARNVTQNIADLRAAVAANRSGVQALRKIVETYGADTVDAYMDFILKNAEMHVLNALKKQPTGSAKLIHDNGSVISVTMTPNPKTGRTKIDFSGSSAAGEHNLNAPLAITRACVLYVLRSLINQDIPLNDGCLRAVELIVPENSILNPSYPRAVSAGNVETSQMVVDAMLMALGAQAGSHGTMNNISFGNEDYQYYETLAGGGGAGPNFHGSTGYQCHMTNSRLTDVEILEERYPVQIHELSVRENSGGESTFCGGDGIVRDMEFLQDMQVSLITNNRIHGPLGLNGGNDGQAGLNTHITKSGETLPLSGCCTISVHAGDHIMIATPGGGGAESA